jgi:serine/threonine protein phosphatase PrpC
MGEDERGTQASALAVRVAADWILTRIYRPFLRETELSSSRPAIQQVLYEAIGKAHQQILRSFPGGKTTLTCAFVLGENAFVAHVGDSRAYLLRGQSISQITTDHSLVNRLIDVGQITAEEAKTHPQRNVLYRALGREGELKSIRICSQCPPIAACCSAVTACGAQFQTRPCCRSCTPPRHPRSRVAALWRAPTKMAVKTISPRLWFRSSVE